MHSFIYFPLFFFPPFPFFALFLFPPFPFLFPPFLPPDFSVDDSLLFALSSFAFLFFLNSLNRLFKSAFLATFPVTFDAATAFFLSLTAFFRWSVDSFFFRSNSCNDKPSIPRSDFNVLLFLLFLPELKMDSFLCALLHTFVHR